MSGLTRTNFRLCAAVSPSVVWGRIRRRRRRTCCCGCGRSSSRSSTTSARRSPARTPFTLEGRILRAPHVAPLKTVRRRSRRTPRVERGSSVVVCILVKKSLVWIGGGYKWLWWSKILVFRLIPMKFYERRKEVVFFFYAARVRVQFVWKRKEGRNPSRYNTEGRGFFDSINFSVFLFLLLYVIVDDHDS